MDEQTLRAIDLERVGEGRYQVTNRRGGTLVVGSGDSEEFSPVELLLVAIAACNAINVDAVATRRSEPDAFTMRMEGHKVRDETGQHLVDLRLTLDARYPEGADGDAAREILPRAMRQSHERICTVSRTVERGTALVFEQA